MASRGLNISVKQLSPAVLLGLCCAIPAACGGGVGSAVGGGSIAPATTFRIEGTSGTPFSATVTDSLASWKIAGIVPVNVEILDGLQPSAMFGSKLVGDQSLLSIAIYSGDTLADVVSTDEPFGSVTIQTGVGLTGIAPEAEPDTRFFVKGAPGDLFDGLIEDLHFGFSLVNVAPTLYLFENPTGRVDGLFVQEGVNYGPLDADLSIDGRIVASGRGSSVSLK